MDGDSIKVRPWYNCKSSPEIGGNSVMSSRKELNSKSSRLETDLSNLHREEITHSIDRDLKEESFGPYQNRNISLVTGQHATLSPVSEPRTGKNIDSHVSLNNNTFMNQIGSKVKRGKKARNNRQKVSEDCRDFEFMGGVIDSDDF